MPQWPNKLAHSVKAVWKLQSQKERLLEVMLKGPGGAGGEEGVEGRRERQLEVKIFQVLK